MGKRIEFARLNLEISKAMFASRVGVSAATYTGWTSGRHSLSSKSHALANHPQMRPDMDVLCDYRHWDMSGLAAQDVRSNAGFARDTSKTWGSGRCAFVVGTQIDFGVFRMLELQIEDGIDAETRVFRSIEEAQGSGARSCGPAPGADHDRLGGREVSPQDDPQ
jgi:hypothetical protein